jgi:hypothetical protein
MKRHPKEAVFAKSAKSIVYRSSSKSPLRLIQTAIILILSLTAAAITGSNNIPSAHALNQSGPSRWSPYGPQMNNMIISVYSDFNTMFNAFTTGQLDITDWPIQPANMGTGGFCDNNANPDFFCTSQTSDFGIFQLDINHHATFLGKNLFQTRTTTPPNIASATIGANPVCSTGHGQLNVILQNQETGNSQILDPLDQVRAVQSPSGSPSLTVSDSGGSSPNGVYKIPCTLAGNYTISTTVYSGSVKTLIGSTENDTITFRVNWNSPSNAIPSQSGTEIGRALAHLLDKPSFVSSFFGGTASYNDIQAPPAQGLTIQGAPASHLPQSILNQDCAEHTWLSPCNPVSAYNFVSDNIGGGAEWWTGSGAAAGATSGYSGVTDLRAACDDFVNAGFTITPSGSTCADVANASTGTVAPASYPHLVPSGNVVMYIRTNAPRKAFGQIFADSINFLFGTPNNGGTVLYGVTASPTYYSISQIANIIFGDGSNPNGWNIYTGGFSLSTTPDHLYSIYSSTFSGGICGGAAEQFPNDYPFYCNPQYDTEAAAGEFADSLSSADSFFANAAVIAHQTVMTIPVYSLLDQFVALNGWNYQQCNGTACSNTQSSLVNVLGHGFQIGFQTLLNMRPVPGYTSSRSMYTPGGGTAGLIRRGFSQSTDNLSPFQATTLWDFEIISQVYDTMLSLNPLTGGANAQLIDWMTTSHSASFNPNEVSCIGNSCVTGTTTQTWRLRNDLTFQDGTAVTANDVAYTIIAYRDIPSANLGPSVANVASAIGLDCGTGQQCKTLQVKLQNQSPFYELNIGSLPILPQHIWAPICGTPPNPASPCGSPTYDPMASGLFIGSGPWECKNILTGTIGGSCTQTAAGVIGTQAIDIGGRALLTAYPNYMRGPTTLQGTSLQKLSWSDKNNDGIINVQDLASIAACYGLAPGQSNAICSGIDSSYWVNPIISTGGTVNINDLATVAFYFGHGTTSPFLPAQLTGMDPQVDPYQVDLTSQSGPVMYYEGGIPGSGQVTVKMVAVSGSPVPSQFTGTLLTSGGTVIGTSSGTTGSSSSIVQFSFTGLVPSTLYQFRLAYNGNAVYTIQVQA